MKIRYILEIPEPMSHMALVKIRAQKQNGDDSLDFFLPVWSPGSYLVREYSRNIRSFKAFSSNGERLFAEKIDKSTYRVDWSKSELNKADDHFEISYEVYCKERSVRTSFIDESHAFIHSPSVFMGVDGVELDDIELEVKLNPNWSKIHTGLKEISSKREEFIYQADNYDDFIDSPLEIGCHESDGFMAFGKEHHLVFYGDQYPHKNNLKSDIKKIVETVGGCLKTIPYDNYLFITHFIKESYGGLEHKNSTVLQFDGRRLANREDYTNWLCLVSHEYFHLWNVKRIRPRELGPFNYKTENYTRMHWLTEGLTSFMDELLVLRSGLISMDEYLTMQTKNLNRYFKNIGKKFHSLEDSSFDAWIKLYRPDENSDNSTISYYLKGGLVFSTLHFELVKQNKSIYDFLEKLWARYESNPLEGMNKEEVLAIIEELGGVQVRDLFDERVSTTKDIDFESYYKEYGMEFIYELEDTPELGAELYHEGGRVLIKKIALDGACYQAGLNAEDEIIALNGIRFLNDDLKIIDKLIQKDQTYRVDFARQGRLHSTQLVLGKGARSLKQIKVLDQDRAKNLFF